MQTVNIPYAKTHLSRLIEEAAKGEAFVIAKAGKPMVRVTPLMPAAIEPGRRTGFLDGVFPLADNVKEIGREEIEEMLDQVTSEAAARHTNACMGFFFQPSSSGQSGLSSPGARGGDPL